MTQQRDEVLAALSFREKLFVLLVAEGKPKNHAYAQAGYKLNPRQDIVDANAAKLAGKAKVKAALTALALRARARAEVTIDVLLAELEEARQAALTENPKQSMASVQATMGKARLLGLDAAQIRHTVEHKPALNDVKGVIELDVDEWKRTFTPRLPES